MPQHIWSILSLLIIHRREKTSKMLSIPTCLVFWSTFFCFSLNNMVRFAFYFTWTFTTFFMQLPFYSCSSTGFISHQSLTEKRVSRWEKLHHINNLFLFVECGSGYYSVYPDSNNCECEICPIATFNDQDYVTSCRRCQTGYTTLEEGSTDWDDCIPGKN